MGAFSVVVRAPGSQRGAGMVQGWEQCLIQQLVPEAALKLSMKAFWVGLPGAM